MAGTPTESTTCARLTARSPRARPGRRIHRHTLFPKARRAGYHGASPALRIDITTAGTEIWHVGLLQSGIALVPGQAYRISFRAKASSARDFKYEVSQNIDPWRQYQPWQAIPPRLSTEWQDYALSFVAPSDTSTAVDTRVLFSVGPGTGTVWISKPSLTTGGPVLETGETLEAGTVPAPGPRTCQPQRRPRATSISASPWPPARTWISPGTSASPSLKGKGQLRIGVNTADTDAAGNSDAHGRTILLSPEWRRHVIRFDDVDFGQEGWGAKAPFSQNKVSGLRLGKAEAGPLDFWVDDIVLLKAN